MGILHIAAKKQVQRSAPSSALTEALQITKTKVWMPRVLISDYRAPEELLYSYIL